MEGFSCVFSLPVLTSILNSLSLLGHPVGFLWLLSLIYIGFAVRRKDRPAVIYGVIFSFIFWILCYGPFGRMVMRPLESPWVNYAGHAYVDNLEMRTGVIVLGGGSIPSGVSVHGIDLNSSGDRVTTGLYAFKSGKGEHLVVSDYNPDNFPQYQAFKNGWDNWMDKENLDASKILMMRPCQSTKDEADAILELIEHNQLKDSKWYLVTSAFHMNRSLKLFRKAGIDVAPIACDFKVVETSVLVTKYPKIIPSIEHLDNVHTAVHEWIGSIVYRLRGWI